MNGGGGMSGAGGMNARPSASRSHAARPGVQVVRVGPVSFRLQWRVVVLATLAAAGVAVLAVWSLTLGSFRLGWDEVYRALTGAGAADARFIVFELRLPRTLTAVAVGAMLAMSGAILQGLLRNPLVSPDIVGINSGATVAAVLWIVTRKPLHLVPVVSFAGALAAAAAIYALTWRGRISSARLILVGIGVNAMMTAATTFLLTRAQIYEASRAMLWMTGSVYASDWDDVRLLAAALALLLPAGVVLLRSLRLLQLGDLTGAALGLAVERDRLLLIVTGCALSSVAVSVAGPIGFVALMVPHLARMLAGPMTAGVFLFTALLGGALVLGADMVGQHALGVSLPVGVVTSALGAPYFLYLLYRAQVRM